MKFDFKTAGALAFIAIAGVLPAEARILASEADCEKLYGKPSARVPGEGGVNCTYLTKEGYSLIGTFVDDRCLKVYIFKKEEPVKPAEKKTITGKPSPSRSSRAPVRTGIEVNEASRMLLTYCGRGNWSPPSRNEFGGTVNWSTGDGKYSANLSGGLTIVSNDYSRIMAKKSAAENAKDKPSPGVITPAT